MWIIYIRSGNSETIIIILTEDQFVSREIHQAQDDGKNSKLVYILNYTQLIILFT